MIKTTIEHPPGLTDINEIMVIQLANALWTIHEIVISDEYNYRAMTQKERMAVWDKAEDLLNVPAILVEIEEEIVNRVKFLLEAE